MTTQVNHRNNKYKIKSNVNRDEEINKYGTVRYKEELRQMTRVVVRRWFLGEDIVKQMEFRKGVMSEMVSCKQRSRRSQGEGVGECRFGCIFSAETEAMVVVYCMKTKSEGLIWFCEENNDVY